MIMLGGTQVFLGPLIGAIAARALDHVVTIYTEHHGLVLGIVILIAVLGLRKGSRTSMAEYWKTGGRQAWRRGAGGQVGHGRIRRAPGMSQSQADRRRHRRRQRHRRRLRRRLAAAGRQRRRASISTRGAARVAPRRLPGKTAARRVRSCDVADAGAVRGAGGADRARRWARRTSWSLRAGVIQVPRAAGGTRHGDWDDIVRGGPARHLCCSCLAFGRRMAPRGRARSSTSPPSPACARCRCTPMRRPRRR